MEVTLKDERPLTLEMSTVFERLCWVLCRLAGMPCGGFDVGTSCWSAEVSNCPGKLARFKVGFGGGAITPLAC